jgi:hypothetical protein
LLLYAAKLIWILRFDFPFRQLGLLLFSLALAVVLVSIFLLQSSFFFFAPATAQAGFPTEFFSGSVEQGATTGHSSGYDSQVQILLQAMVSAAPFLQPWAQGLCPILFAADIRLLHVLCLAIWSSWFNFYFSLLGLLFLLKRAPHSSDDFPFSFGSPTACLVVLRSPLVDQSCAVRFDSVANNFGVHCCMRDSRLLQVEAGSFLSHRIKRLEVS